MPDICEPPLQRENRLYQSDWLIRLYGFSLNELITPETPFLDLNMDPKQAYALSHPEAFPVDINTADREMILRVPGIGIKSANRIVGLRRRGRIRYEHLKQMGVVLSRANGHIHCDGMPAPHWVNTFSAGTAVQRPDREGRIHTKKPRVIIYDGTFDGLLTVLYRTYEDQCVPEAIKRSKQSQLGLFDEYTTVDSDLAIAERVWEGLKKRLGWKHRQKLYHAFLSSAPEVEMAICRYVHDVVPAGNEGRAHLASHLRIHSLAQRVGREAHRMKGFVRFQRLADDRYLALVSPRYDVLPLIRRHFEARFADQEWIIYDTRRNYGLVYDGDTTKALQLDLTQLGSAPSDVEANEREYQSLWQQYYRAINIDLRNNPRLHLQRLPRRYWRYLTEKQ
jgi:probable DNA metabolism protein